MGSGGGFHGIFHGITAFVFHYYMKENEIEFHIHRIPKRPRICYTIMIGACSEQKTAWISDKMTRISQKPENTEFIYEDTITRNLHSVHERPAGG